MNSHQGPLQQEENQRIMTDKSIENGISRRMWSIVYNEVDMLHKIRQCQSSRNIFLVDIVSKECILGFTDMT